MRQGTEYFLDEFWTPDPEEVFIDGGGYTGDTIEEFIRWTKGNYRRIYSFEPEKEKFEEMKANPCCIDNRIKLHNKGLWSSNAKLRFLDGDKDWSGSISDKGNSIIETVALDDVVQDRVTFIKMDIEGAEFDALKGAKTIIKRDCPKMAICIYHKPDDLWEVPLLIKSINDRYRFFIRHKGMRYFGTILYCVPYSK